ncbi:MAG: winged helix-turn-helix transcriptional regulator [Chloroflexi bacterium]|nr:MarR family winged helix-turn-helix transcriptional regulator [Gammaproteobacteria bacterium]MYA20952.1 winged helix-turn-helix transcriptional regulator [Chloroflexota bacterium]
MTQPQGDANHRTDPPPADLEECVAGLVNAVDKGMASEVAPYGLTPLEFSLLRHCLEEECTATHLARVLPVDGSRVSRLVTGLVDKGLVRRRRLRRDRRIVMLRLSEEGRELTTDIVEKMKIYDAILTEGIDEEEMRVFMSVSSRIIANHAALQGPG